MDLCSVKGVCPSISVMAQEKHNQDLYGRDIVQEVVIKTIPKKIAKGKLAV